MKRDERIERDHVDGIELNLLFESLKPFIVIDGKCERTLIVDEKIRNDGAASVDAVMLAMGRNAAIEFKPRIFTRNVPCANTARGHTQQLIEQERGLAESSWCDRA